MPTARRLPLLAVGLVLLAGACAPAAPPSASSPTSARPTPVPSDETSGVDHATGATDVILRYEEGGGFMPVEWSLATVPIFTLYGDGTVIFRDPTDQAPPDRTGLLVYEPLQTAKLSPDQMQELLTFAVTEGGLAAARDRYDNPMLADAGNAVFTINAAGRSKQVTVSGLSESDTTAPDQLSRSQFLALADRLRNFDEVAGVETTDWEPMEWRVHLIDAAGAQPAVVHAWPWPDLTPRDFPATGEDPTAPAFPHRTMTAEELGALGQGDPEGGLMGYFVKGPNGGLYSLVVRPLLPGDED